MAEAEKRAEDERLVAAEERERVREDREFNQRLYNMFYPVCVCVCVCVCAGAGKCGLSFFFSFLFMSCAYTHTRLYIANTHALSLTHTDALVLPGAEISAL